MNTTQNIEDYDCLIIGGGPAGLTAAIYLARFHLSVLLVDGGRSRAAMIPVTHNHPGFSGGIAGSELLARMRDQASLYGARFDAGEVLSLKPEVGSLLVAKTAFHQWRAKTVLLATGVVNTRPKMAEAIHDEALARGLLRYCPVCDGYEVTDRRIGVIGTGEYGLREAEFLRSFTSNLSLISPDAPHQGVSGISCTGVHNGYEGDHPWHDGKSLLFRIAFWTNYWRVLMRRQLSRATGFSIS